MKRTFSVLVVLTVLCGTLAASITPSAAAPSLNMPPDGGISWIAMGDSYASGEGNETIPAADTCQRADGADGRGRAWAVVAERTLIGQGVSVAPDQFKFVACTGAVAANWENQFAESGSQPADLVTFSFGGNNVGFASILEDCIGTNRPDMSTSWVAPIVSSVMPWIGCTLQESELIARVDKWAGLPATTSYDVGVALPQLISDVAARAVVPGGKIVVTGYPQLFEESGRWGVWQGNHCYRVRRSDADMFRGVIALMNQRLAEATQAASGKVNGVEIAYVDAAAAYESASGRHGLCGSDSWINGIRIDRQQRSFHPTQQGHDALGAAVAARVNEFDFSTVAPGAGTRCGTVQTEDGPLETEVVAGQAFCSEVLKVLGGLVGTPPDPALRGDFTSGWTLREWSCSADTRESGAIVYSCRNPQGAVIATVAVAAVEPEPPVQQAPASDAKTGPCVEAIAAADPLRMARIAVDAINAGNIAPISDCLGTPTALGELQQFQGDAPWKSPESCMGGVDYECWTSNEAGFTIIIQVYADSAGAQIQGAEGVGGGM